MQYTLDVMIDSQFLTLDIPSGREMEMATKVRDLLRRRYAIGLPLTSADPGAFAATLIKDLDVPSIGLSGGDLPGKLSPRIIVDFNNGLFGRGAEVAFEIAQDPDAGSWGWPLDEYAALHDEEIKSAWREFVLIVKNYRTSNEH
jgi:hypothetical protein